MQLPELITIFKETPKNNMSWFKHSPPKHPSHRPQSQPHRTSPATEKMMEEAKKSGPQDKLQRKSK
jgi:hypothetical protein